MGTQLHHEISEKSKCLIKPIRQIPKRKPVDLHVSMAMHQDWATFIVNSPLTMAAWDMGMETASV